MAQRHQPAPPARPKKPLDPPLPREEVALAIFCAGFERSVEKAMRRFDPKERECTMLHEMIAAWKLADVWALAREVETEAL